MNILKKISKALIIASLLIGNGCNMKKADEKPDIKISEERVFWRDFIAAEMLQTLRLAVKEDTLNYRYARFYNSIMTAYGANGDPRFVRRVKTWGEKYAWKVGNDPDDAHKLACAEVWLDLYFHEDDPQLLMQSKSYKYVNMEKWPSRDLKMLRPSITWLSARPSATWYKDREPLRADFAYIGPVLAKLYNATGDKSYLEILHSFWADLCGGLWDQEKGLFYKDVSNKELSSSANGWIISALVRVIDNLSEDDPKRSEYRDLYKHMCSSLARLQGKGGAWPEDLSVPGQSSSAIGTACFIYAIGWGIRNGVLDKDSYVPVLHSAWRKLTSMRIGNCAAQPDFGAAFLMAASEIYRLADEFPVKAPPSREISVALLDRPMKISSKFRRGIAPGSEKQNNGKGRTTVRLTSEGTACYPLYYFAPTFSKDGRYLVYHRYDNKKPNPEVQLWRLDLHTAESVQLTYASKTDHHGRTDWYGYASGPDLRGVADYRSAINQEHDEVIYFDGTEARAVNLITLEDRHLFELPADRQAQGQNCVSPDGQWFVYLTGEIQDTVRGRGAVPGRDLMAYNFDTQEQRKLFTIASTSHHVEAYGSEFFCVHHPPGDMGGMGMAFGDLNSDNWRLLRYGDPGIKDFSCHALPTPDGFAYECFSMITDKGERRLTPMRAGLYNPLSRKRLEWHLPPSWSYVHTGWDPSGRLYFWEHSQNISYLEQLDPEKGGQFRFLGGCGTIYTGDGQRYHPHPQVTPDHRWILYTGGDDHTKTQQLFLMDISDISDTQGVTRQLLSHTGENDVDKPGVILSD